MIVSTGVKLRLVQIVDRGIVGKERIHLEVISPCELSFYVLIATIQISPTSVYAGGRPTYWFTPLSVPAGDHVIVYTAKTAEYIARNRNDGHINHFFYWGTQTPLFINPLSKVVIAELNNWVTEG